MKQNNDMQIARHRVVMAALGGLAGLGLWALGDQWDNPAMSPALYLALFSFVAAYSAVVLSLAGPIPVRRALTGGMISAIPVAVLMSLAGMRHVVATDLLDDPVMLTVVSVFVVFSTPFLMVWLQNRRRWMYYADLFDAAWTMTVRYVVAWGFVGVFWLVAFLSDSLLDLVEVHAVDVVLGSDWARFVLSGAVLGLGLAVVYELRETISPYLFLRLLRLLVPVVLVVVVVFLVVVPFRGLTQLFGEFSAAGTLMGAAIVAITLISTALDQNDAGAVSTRGIRLATRGLALVLPLLAVLAVWCVVLRVRQYGWTPDRILAASVTAFLLAYGISYCGAVLARAGWMARIRRVNVAMALAVIAVSAVWMTPVLDVYRISTTSQIARFEEGRSSLEQLALWQMAHDWGRAGQNGLMRLETMSEREDFADLQAHITAARSETNPFRFEQAINRRTAPDRAMALLDLMPLRPEGEPLHAQAFAGVPSYRLDQWLEGCRRSLPDGRAGCVFVQGGFSPTSGPGGQGVVLFLDSDGRARANHVLLRNDAVMAVREMFDPVADRWPVLPGDIVAKALDGEFNIRPTGGRALFIGDAVLVPGN